MRKNNHEGFRSWYAWGGLLENLGVRSGISPTKSYSEKKKKNLTDLLRWAARTERLTAAITATPVGFYKWLILLQGSHKHPAHLSDEGKHNSHSQNSISKVYFLSEYCKDLKKICTITYYCIQIISYIVINLIHCGSPALKLHSFWGHFK